MFIWRTILCVFKPDCIDFKQKNILLVDLYLQICTAAAVSLFMCQTIKKKKKIDQPTLLYFFERANKQFFLGLMV